ncbi:MAG: phage tail sheath subtilisin-like domain-containing protein [Cyanobacteria bacterium P01_D01_bin.156]
MPEYLAPGVYIEEVSFRSKSIEGVGTSTTGFVGATRYGPVDGEPELMTSFSQFERIYGGLDPLEYEGTAIPNYLAQSVRNFFDNGGSRLYIARAYEPPALPLGPPGESPEDLLAREALLGRAISPIHAPDPLVDSLDATTILAADGILTALNNAIVNLQQTRAATITILQFAVDQALSVVDPPPFVQLDFDYGTSEDDIGTQLSNFVAGLPAGQEQTDIQAALDDPWQAVIDAADEQLQRANAALETAEAEQTAISAAYEVGVTGGEDVDITNQTPADAATLNDATTLVTGAVNAVETAAAAVATAVTDLGTALTEVTNDSEANIAIAAVTEVITRINDVLTASENPTNADDAINDAANTVTQERRLAAANAAAAAAVDWLARFPGAAGNSTIQVTGRLGANVLMAGPAVGQIRNGDLVVIVQGGSALIHSVTRQDGDWSFVPETGAPLSTDDLDAASDRVIPLTLTVEIFPPGRFAQPFLRDGLTVSELSERRQDSVTQVFGAAIANRVQAMETPVILQPRNTTIPAAQLAADLLGLADWSALLNQNVLSHTRSYTLAGGNDGLEPTPIRYEGMGDDSSPTKSGLRSLEDLEEISIVAAPGYSYDWGGRQSEILTISQALINHCERMRYRVAVLDSPDNQPLSGVRDYRALLDTTRAAVYYPWVVINDPITNQDLSLPPSGFMAGIYARNDVEIGVHKAPANEVVRNAIGLEVLINKAQQDVLNPLGINCIRFFEGRGIRVWGARTISSDPEWKYLNIRRFFAYLEASIDRSTQWAVFEPNGERLWANIRRTVESFLENEWKEGRLAGTKLEEAFFVRCDRSTMTQNDLDNGRLICLIGVAPLYPAEYVIFRIGQKTLDS